MKQRILSYLWGAFFLAVPLHAQAQGYPVDGACRNALEGRVPWSGTDKHWSSQNLERLWAGGVGAEPAACYARLMRGEVNWGGGTHWEWDNAANLCHGSQDGRATIACFEGCCTL